MEEESGASSLMSLSDGGKGCHKGTNVKMCERVVEAAERVS